MRAVSGNNLGRTLHGVRGRVACTDSASSATAGWESLTAASGAWWGTPPAQSRAATSVILGLALSIYLTELPKPAVESPPTSVSKAFTPSKVSSQPTSRSREGWLGQEHSRLASPAWGSFPSQWSRGEGVQPSGNDSAHQGAEPTS